MENVKRKIKIGKLQAKQGDDKQNLMKLFKNLAEWQLELRSAKKNCN